MSTPSNTRSADSTTTGDLKEALGSRRKPDTTHVRYSFIVYTSRACEYGDDKYERANYRRPTGGKAHSEPTAEDFRRFRAYLRAAKDHVEKTLDAMELHQAGDYHLTDVEGMKRAAYAADTDETPGNKIGASRLPHVSPAAASLNMAITQAVDCGLLPADPGAPWLDQAEPARLQPGDRVRVTSAGPEFLHGKIGTVRGHGRPGIVYLQLDEDGPLGRSLWFGESEIEAIGAPKVEAPKARQWQVGDRVRVVASQGVFAGELGRVTRSEHDRVYVVLEDYVDQFGFRSDELEPVTTGHVRMGDKGTP